MIRYPSPEKTFVGVVFAAVAVGIWGITFVSSKYLLGSFSALELLLLRFLLAYVGLWALRPRRLRLSRRRDEVLFMLAGLTGVTVYQFMENVAIFYTSASNVSIIVSICPIFTAIIAQVFLRERHLTPLFLLGFAIATVGIALVSFNGVVVLHLSPKGDLLALGAAVSWGFYSLFVSKINALRLDSVMATRRIFFWALVFMLPLALLGAVSAAGAGDAVVGNAGAALADNAAVTGAADRSALSGTPREAAADSALVTASGIAATTGSATSAVAGISARSDAAVADTAPSAAGGAGASHSFSLTLDAATNLRRFSDWRNWLNLVFLGWGASAFCFVAWNLACNTLGTVRATVGIYLIPVVTIVFAFFVLGERISAMGALGTALVICGLFVSEWRKRR